MSLFVRNRYVCDLCKTEVESSEAEYVAPLREMQFPRPHARYECALGQRAHTLCDACMAPLRVAFDVLAREKLGLPHNQPGYEVPHNMIVAIRELLK